MTHLLHLKVKTAIPLNVLLRNFNKLLMIRGEQTCTIATNTADSQKSFEPVEIVAIHGETEPE